MRLGPSAAYPQPSIPLHGGICQCLCTVADKSNLNFSMGGCKSAIHLAPPEFGHSLFLWGAEAGAPRSAASAHLRPNGSSADSLCSAGILLFLDPYFLEGNKQHLAPVQASLMGWEVGEEWARKPLSLKFQCIPHMSCRATNGIARKKKGTFLDCSSSFEQIFRWK